ncbi:MAG: MarR family transcriptional regulator [Deltaproteobacteria bacterium]|nr:MarR family transcriptional regulator [Deltaproteobacteria bacterium]
MPKEGYVSDLTLDEKVMMGIVRASEQFKKRYSALFRNYGLTFSQYSVLRALSSSKDGENTITNIRKIMLVSGANMTGIAKRLAKKGFIIRKGDPSDERITLLQITPKGLQTLRNVMDEKNEYLTAVLSDLSGDAKQRILSQLKVILKKA